MVKVRDIYFKQATIMICLLKFDNKKDDFTIRFYNVVTS